MVVCGESHRMGKLTYIHRDLFTTGRRVIAHGCNIRGKFGSGVAAQIARRFPEVKRAYLKKFREARDDPAGGWHLGDIQLVITDSGKIVVNMATQDGYGRGGIHVDYDAVGTCFGSLLDYCHRMGPAYGLAIPKVGAGLAGGDWGRIESIIAGHLETRNVEVDVHVLG
jgi:O-acetyl-ADP-ribose deacetylase (regulator of RNase III)